MSDLYMVAGAAVGAASLIGAAIGTYVRLTVRSELAAFKSQLLESLDSRFMPRREAETLLGEMCRRLDSLEGRKR